MRTLKILLVLSFVSCIGAPLGEDEVQQAGVSAPLKVWTRPDGTSSYEVLFTNPACGVRDESSGQVTRGYDFAEDITTFDGDTRTATHPGTYCFPQYDSRPSGDRPTSPLFRLRAWIDSTREGDQIVAAYFSFSNKAVRDALIAAVGRKVRVTFIMDLNQDHSVAQALVDADVEHTRVAIVDRGNVNDIGYHHNKFFIVNPLSIGTTDTTGSDGTRYMKLAFSSGNMSSGTVLHQENWHFMEVDRNSYFAQSHVCVVKGLLDTEEPLAYTRRKLFTEHMDTCRAAITAAPETDISAFFIPSRTDSNQLRDRIVGSINGAESVDVAAHRFSLSYMQQALRTRLTSNPDFTARLVADDDLYWLQPMPPAQQEDLGDNMPFEATNAITLIRAGGGISSALPGRFEARFVETNPDAHLLHHNKFLIAHAPEGGTDTVVCGAANFTNDAFWYGSGSAKNNFENIYVVQVPHIVAAMKRQFDGFWGNAPDAGAPIATPVTDMATCTLEEGQVVGVDHCAAYTRAVEEPHVTGPDNN